MTQILTDERINKLMYKHTGINPSQFPDEHKELLEFARALLAANTQAPAVPERLNALYITVNHLMAKIGLYGEVDIHSPEVDAVMNALYDIDGGAVCKRAQELHEKASMPLFDAMNLVVREFPSLSPVSQQAAKPEAAQSEQGDIYRRMWEDFVSLQSGDVKLLCKDAERYRWRHSLYVDPDGFEYGYVKVKWLNGKPESVLWASDEEIDAAMKADAAMQSQKPEGA